jgi:hypothetical protein
VQVLPGPTRFGQTGEKSKLSRPGQPPRSVLRTVLSALLIGLFGAGLAGVASAFWSGTGAGASAANTATAVAVAVSPGTPDGTLSPGGRSGVTLTVSNPNRFQVHIGSLAGDTSRGTSGFGVDPGHSGCAVSVLTVQTQTNAGAGWSIPAKVGDVDGSLPVTLTDALAMSVDAADACQGATFAVAMTAGP